MTNKYFSGYWDISYSNLLESMTHTVWVNALVNSTWPLPFCQGLKMHDLLSDIGDWLAGAGNAVTNTDWVVTSLTSSLDKTMIIAARHVSERILFFLWVFSSETPITTGNAINQCNDAFLKYAPLPSKVGLFVTFTSRVTTFVQSLSFQHISLSFHHLHNSSKRSPEMVESRPVWEKNVSKENNLSEGFHSVVSKLLLVLNSVNNVEMRMHKNVKKFLGKEIFLNVRKH